MSTGTLSDRGIDLSCASLLSYAGGATATVSSTMLALTPSRATVSGTLGNVELPRRFHCPSEYTVTPADPGEAPTTYDVDVLGNGYVHEIEEVHRCLREGRTESTLVPLGRHGVPDAADGPDTPPDRLPSPGRPLVMSPRV